MEDIDIVPQAWQHSTGFLSMGDMEEPWSSSECDWWAFPNAKRLNRAGSIPYDKVRECWSTQVADRKAGNISVF